MAILKVKDADGNIYDIPAIRGERGKDGKSAYEYAQEGGYTGTEEDFMKDLASIGEVMSAFVDVSNSNIIDVSEEGR